MTAAVKLVGKVAAGFVDQADQPRTAEWAEKLAAIPLNRMQAKQMATRTTKTDRLRSAISLPGNPHMAGVASLFPLRAELAQDFRPTFLADSTDLFHPSFDIRGPVAASGIEAHLTFTVHQDAALRLPRYPHQRRAGHPPRGGHHPAGRHRRAAEVRSAVGTGRPDQRHAGHRSAPGPAQAGQLTIFPP
jgi:hypothetical protein